jgi:hypothetical protein
MEREEPPTEKRVYRVNKSSHFSEFHALFSIQTRVPDELLMEGIEKHFAKLLNEGGVALSDH